MLPSLSVMHSLSRNPVLSGDPALEERLSQTVRDMVTALNNRNFNPKSYPWRQTAGDFQADTCFAEFNRTTKLDDFLYCFDRYTQENPTYELYCKDTAVTVNEKGTKALVFVNFACLGTPPGTVRHSVGLVEASKLLGKWYCMKYQCLPGLTVYHEDSSDSVF